MRILQILPELNVGGVETGTLDLSKCLVKGGHASFVVSNGGRLVENLEKGGSKHLTLPVHKKSLWTVLRMIKEVRRIIIDHKIDIVHARSRVPAWIAFFACRGTDASFITTCHGYYKNKFFSQVMGWAKRVIVPSEAIGRHMIDHFKVPAESIRRIPRSVDLDRFAAVKKEKHKGNGPIIAMVGRITPLKGHTYFLQAMAKVVRKYPYAKVWIIGDAPVQKEAYKRELEDLAKRLGLSTQVSFLGNRSDVPELLAQADVLVLSTVTPESFGRVILEAQAVGVPVVATQVGGVIDIIDHERTGLLVTPKDPDSMAEAVMRLWEDKSLAQRLIEAAKKKLQDEFTLDKMASRTIAVYEELLRSMNLLVIKISSIGDVVLVTASLKAIRNKFPKANIYCLVGKESRKVLQSCPYINELVIYDHKDKGWWGVVRMGANLRKYRFDKVVDFQNSRKSHALAFLCMPRESYGYNRRWGFLLSNPLKSWRDDVPAVPHKFQLLQMLGIEMPKEMSLELWPSKRDDQYIQQLLEAEWLGSAQNIIGINIAASENWSTKNWPIEYIARLCDLLAAQNIRVVVTGMQKDQPKVLQLLSMTKAKPANLVGKTDILQLAALMKRCKVYLTPDSAPLHVAAAVNTPIITFFGPTDATRHVPPAKTMVILDKKLACAPCYSPRCRILTHACMKDISPEEVLRNINELMGVKV